MRKDPFKIKVSHQFLRDLGETQAQYIYETLQAYGIESLPYSYVNSNGKIKAYCQFSDRLNSYSLYTFITPPVIKPEPYRLQLSGIQNPSLAIFITKQLDNPWEKEMSLKEIMAIIVKIKTLD